MVEFWRNFLVYPLLDLLILFYNTIAFGNMGVAVIEMTLALRLILMPINIKAEKEAAKYERLETEVTEIQVRFKNDTVEANEHIRALLKARKINPWAKTAILLVQFLVFVLLYQVFLSGINSHLDHLAPWLGNVQQPVNTKFLGVDIGDRNFFWALGVGALLFFEITLQQRKVAHLTRKPDMVYRYAFPLFTIVVLSLLPMVKSLFVLTSMLFSLTISNMRRALWPTDSTK